MNNTRRKQLATIASKLTAIQSELENIKDDEDDYRDNIPENLEGSGRYESSESASDDMDDALASIAETIDKINEAITE